MKGGVLLSNTASCWRQVLDKMKEGWNWGELPTSGQRGKWSERCHLRPNTTRRSGRRPKDLRAHPVNLCMNHTFLSHVCYRSNAHFRSGLWSEQFLCINVLAAETMALSTIYTHPVILLYSRWMNCGVSGCLAPEFIHYRFSVSFSHCIYWIRIMDGTAEDIPSQPVSFFSPSWTRWSSNNHTITALTDQNSCALRYLTES